MRRRRNRHQFGDALDDAEHRDLCVAERDKPGVDAVGARTGHEVPLSPREKDGCREVAASDQPARFLLAPPERSIWFSAECAVLWMSRVVRGHAPLRREFFNDARKPSGFGVRPNRVISISCVARQRLASLAKYSLLGGSRDEMGLGFANGGSRAGCIVLREP